MARSGRIVLFCVVASLGAANAVSAQAPAAAPAAAPAPESIAKAEQVLVESRKALGGEKLAAVKTLVASGQTRRIRGNNLVPIEFEILFELPDKYLRVDEFPAEDTDPTSAGLQRRRADSNPAVAGWPSDGPGAWVPLAKALPRLRPRAGHRPHLAPRPVSRLRPRAAGAANPGAPGTMPPGAPAGMGRGGRGPAPDPTACTCDQPSSRTMPGSRSDCSPRRAPIP